MRHVECKCEMQNIYIECLFYSLKNQDYQIRCICLNIGCSDYKYINWRYYFFLRKTLYKDVVVFVALPKCISAKEFELK
jgi:hypothetical protein